jgi:hypothetical protein
MLLFSVAFCVVFAVLLLCLQRRLVCLQHHLTHHATTQRQRRKKHDVFRVYVFSARSSSSCVVTHSPFPIRISFLSLRLVSADAGYYHTILNLGPSKS